MTVTSGGNVGDGATLPLPTTRPSRHRILGRLKHQPFTIACLAVVGLLVAVAILAPLIAPFAPDELDVTHRLEGPSATHWLGTDDLGRDVASRLIFGARVAVRASFQSVGLAMVVGVSLGLLVGYLGGWWDRLAMRGADIVQSIPALIFAFAVIAILGRGLNQASIAVALVFAITFMRITRGLTLREREQLYVDAARVASLRTPRIIFREILPNIVGPLIVEAAILLGSAILIIAMLSFLGLGIDAESADWGTMLDEARSYQSLQPFLAVPPGLAITFAVLLFNFTGDGLRDVLTGKRHHRVLRPHAYSRSSAPRARALAAPPHPAPPAVDTVLRVEDLHVEFPSNSGAPMEVLSGIDFTLRRGETLGLVGESGSGKSMTALAMLGLVPVPGIVTAGNTWFGDRNLLAMPDRELARIRGSEIAMIFQDPVASFSPIHTIGQQLVEPLRVHRGMSERDATKRVVDLLDVVGVPDARRRLRDYPHEFSGGMAQRAMIAMALSCEPRILIADEPTTALDVTIQAQVLDLLRNLVAQFEMSVLLITHDLGVIGEACDRVLVMYAGQLVEQADAVDLFAHPRHPYTHALLSATPRNESRKGPLPTIPGRVPPPWNWPEGCRFHPRCPYVADRCRTGTIPFRGGNRCIRANELTLEVDG